VYQTVASLPLCDEERGALAAWLVQRREDDAKERRQGMSLVK